jgi:hypothetical protein
MISTVRSRGREHDVRFQRFLLALALSTTMGLAAGCAGESDGTTAGAAGAAGAPSPSIDLKADTETVCKAIVAIYKEDLLEITGKGFAVIIAIEEQDKAAEAEARAALEAIFQRVTPAVDAALAKAADPAAKAALQRFAATMAKLFLAPEKLDDPALDAEMTKAEAEAMQYCPALVESSRSAPLGDPSPSTGLD